MGKLALHVAALVVIVALCAVVPSVEGRTKCIMNLDIWTWDKVVTPDRTIIVKFDIEWPHGEEHEAFNTMAEEIANATIPPFVGEVRTKEHEESINVELLNRLKIDEEELPIIWLLKAGQHDKPIVFEDMEGRTSDMLNRWVIKETGHWIPLIGAIPELQQIAFDVKHKQKSAEEALAKFEELKTKYDKRQEEKESVAYYIQLMQRVKESGAAAIEAELARVAKVRSSRISSKQKSLLDKKLNVITSFDHAPTAISFVRFQERRDRLLREAAMDEERKAKTREEQEKREREEEEREKREEEERIRREAEWEKDFKERQEEREQRMKRQIKDQEEAEFEEEDEEDLSIFEDEA